MSLGFQVRSGDRILAIAPHQDDECIGCGGALVKWRAAGAVTGVLWVSSTPEGMTIGDEAQSAARVLGAEWTRSLGAPPVGLNADSSWLDLLVAALREFRPSIVLLPHAEEDDRQHRVVAELGREAIWISAYPIRPDLGTCTEQARAVLAYEVWTPISKPTLYCDITSYAAAKEDAIACYESQIMVADFKAAALGLNRYRGVMSGAGTFAEAFTILHFNEEITR